MSDDLYRHHHLELKEEQYGNLLTLARYLMRHAEDIDARKALAFGYTSTRRLRPIPAKIVADPPPAIPALGYGPFAGIAARESDDWRTYCLKAFGVAQNAPLLFWLHYDKWETTEPSALGAGLRIVYALEYGVPTDYLAISAGDAYTDYDTNGFAWDKLDMLPVNLTDDGKDFVPLRQWPTSKPRA